MNDLKDLSFLIYGLGITGKSVVNFFNKNRFKNYKVWDDTNKSLYNKKRPISVVADNVEVRNINNVKIRVNNHIKFKLFYDSNNSLTKKIKLEQSRNR